MEFTGERFVPGIGGDINLEHMHRYLLACRLVHGKRVLDIASGEGYGSDMMSEIATSVVGVDIDKASVTHARRTYPRSNINFLVGSANDIPVADATVDVVVSFETIEHLTDHQRMMLEIKRVLVSGGVLVLSSPDRYEYSDIPHSKNPFHLRELYLSELKALLAQHFSTHAIYNQRVHHASVIAPSSGKASAFMSYRANSDNGVVECLGLPNPLYFIAVASDGPLPELPAGIFIPRQQPFMEQRRGGDGAASTGAEVSISAQALRSPRPQQDLSVVAVIPLYNGVRWIEQSIASVLAQRLPPDELIVVDDGSTDGGAGAAIVERMAKEHPIIRLLHKSNDGQSSARNFGVRHSSSALIAFLDQDDAWYPRHLEMLVKPFGEEHDIPLGWVYSNLDRQMDNGALFCCDYLDDLPYEQPKRHLQRCLKEDMHILPSASLISRAAFESVGGFDERLKGYEDDDLFLRMFTARWKNLYLPKSLSRWHVNNSSASYTPTMARSRMIYARKLLAEYPDNAIQNLYFARDCIAPRFFRVSANDFRTALELKDRDGLRRALRDMMEMASHLPASVRIPFYLAAPFLRSLFLSRIILTARRLAYRALRRV